MEKPKIRSTLRKKNKRKPKVHLANLVKVRVKHPGIFIEGNVPSSKNGRMWTGKFSIASKTTRKYYKNSEGDWEIQKYAFLNLLKDKEKPYKISFLFIRGSKHKFDYANPLNTVQDRMVKFGWIPDDDADTILPVLIPYEYDKAKPGVWIDVL